MNPQAANIDHAMMRDIVHEAKQLREINAELLLALKACMVVMISERVNPKDSAWKQAEAAIAKAGEF